MIKKICFVLIIIGLVTVALLHYNDSRIAFLYTTILALFPKEIRIYTQQIIGSLKKKGQIRVSYAYLFRIQIGNLYLLVKDEQGRKEYHPVGGVYKYNPDEIDVAEKFGGEYDGLFEMSTDTEYDLRLSINRKSFNDFDKWFRSGLGRENQSNLSREFREELISRGLVPVDVFNRIRYKYVGSQTQRSWNSDLGIPQIRHFDVFNISLNSNQQHYLNNMRNKRSSDYVFASEVDIERGIVTFAGANYNIAKTAKCILIKNRSTLKKEFSNKKTYVVKIN